MVDHFANPPQTFYDHIREVRKRLTWSALAFLIGATAGYLVHKPLIAFLKKPLNQSLYFTSPAGSFNFVMKICFLVGIAVALPVIIYNIVAFVQPAFPKQLTRKIVRRISLLSVLLALVGAAFAFLVVVPMSLKFFMGFAVDGLQPLISAEDYLKFVINCLISFVIIFQTPLIILFIDRIKPLPPKTMLKYEKFVIVGSLALALVLPFTYDPLTQFLLAIPIIALYNLSIVLLMFTHRKRRTKQKPHVARTPPFTLDIPHIPLSEPLLAPEPVAAAEVAPQPHISSPPLHRQRPNAQRSYKRRSIDGILPRRNFIDLDNREAEAA